MLTIKSFSRITAIPESTLRYYDDQGILRPRARAENGYRLYEADQILPAKLLYSLRLASVPMDQVRAYVQADSDARKRALSRWHNDLGERIAWLTVARKYIEGLVHDQPGEITLQTTEPERTLWFTHEAPVGHFGSFYVQRIGELCAAGIPFDDSYFRWLEDLQPGWVRGQVGFRLAGRVIGDAPLPEGAAIEERPSTLMLSLEHRAPMPTIRETYSRLFAFMQEQGWKAAGPAIERYPVGAPENFCEVLIPILNLER